MLSRLDDDLDTDRPLVVFLELRARGVAGVRVHPHELVVEMADDEVTFSVAGRALRPDLVVGWVLDDLLYPGMTHLEVFQRVGVPVINDAPTLFRAQSKYLDSAMLASAGALGYPVISGRDPEALERWLRELGGPAVMKPLVGFGGRGLRRIDGEADIARAVEEVAADGAAYYAVPWIDNPGRDIRVYTINHQPIFAMYRYAPPGEWITNVRAGGGIAMCPVTEEIAEVTQRASRAAGTLIGGVDLGEDQATGQLVVYETNSCPTCEPPVLRELADFLAAAVRDPDSALATWRPGRVHDEPGTDGFLFHPSKHAAIRRQADG